MHKLMTITMQDGSVWGVPVEIIARHRAQAYADEFGGDIERSLAEDTIPLFEIDDYEISSWAEMNMDWSDFDGHLIKITDATPPFYENEWLIGAKNFLDEEPSCVVCAKVSTDNRPRHEIMVDLVHARTRVEQLEAALLAAKD